MDDGGQAALRSQPEQLRMGEMHYLEHLLAGCRVTVFTEAFQSGTQSDPVRGVKPR
jgi:hypothetical protein